MKMETSKTTGENKRRCEILFSTQIAWSTFYLTAPQNQAELQLEKWQVTSKAILISMHAAPQQQHTTYHHYLLICIFQCFPAFFHLGFDLRGDYAVHFGILDAQFFHDVLESQLAFLKTVLQLLEPSTESQYLPDLGKSLAVKNKSESGFPGSSPI